MDDHRIQQPGSTTDTSQDTAADENVNVVAGGADDGSNYAECLASHKEVSSAQNIRKAGKEQV